MSLVIVLLLIIKGPSYIALLLVVRLLLQIFTNYLLFLLTVDFYLSLLYNNIIETRRKKMSNEENKRRLQLPDEVNVEELLAELEAYRWRDKKALIVKELGASLYISGSFNHKEKLKAYEEQKWIRLIDRCYIIDEVDELMSQGYTFDEIVRAIKEHIAEQLEAEKEFDLLLQDYEETLRRIENE